jgi:hypothetical protein
MARDSFDQGHYEPTQRLQAEKTRRMFRNFETQAVVARAMAKSARYTFWVTVIAAATAVVTAAAAVFSVIALHGLPR